MNTTKRYEPTLTFNTRKISFTNLLQRAVKKVDAKKALVKKESNVRKASISIT